MKFESNVNELIEEEGDHGMLTVPPFNSRYAAEKPSEEVLTVQNEKSGCDEKEEDVPEEMMLPTFHTEEKHRFL